MSYVIGCCLAFQWEIDQDDLVNIKKHFQNWHLHVKNEVDNNMYTINFHLLQHIYSTVKALGPLRAYSIRSAKRSIGVTKKGVQSKRKFETKPYEEEAAAEFDNEKKKYINFSLDIGWSMHKIYGPRKQKNNVHTYLKKCNGFVRCNEKGCRFYLKELHLQFDVKLINKQYTVIGCKNCGSVLEHVDTCPAEVRYRFVNTKCKLEQIGNHNHGPYVSNHLSEEEKDKLTERLLVDPTVTPKAAVQDINCRTGQIVDSVVDINPILGEFLGEFGKIMNNYTGSPAIKTYCRFSDLPAVTDVTYKAIEKGYYLCTTVIYIKELKKHAVIFQAVMDGLSHNYFAQYFFAFFTECKRISSNNNIIPYDKADKFRELVYTIRTTKDAEEFCRSCNEVVTRYKNSYKWLQWWLQPSISSMIFRHCMGMDDNLRKHPYRTTNAVELFHRNLYQDTIHHLPLSLALPQILNYIRSDERILANYKKHAVPATYNRAPRATHKRP
ncbi:hypothetical protein INT45_013839 [Circinella minor]|uniref:Uncharacterized protein n=1 Tax=Circinella minor TaxID=1195481 RepID=A0A8H7VHJ4_9FUNG|nr:hypothetical protein INT45_013839 [Circinella minor]